MDTEKAYPLLGEDLFENSMEAISLYTHLSRMHRYSLQFPDPQVNKSCLTLWLYLCGFISNLHLSGC